MLLWVSNCFGHWPFGFGRSISWLYTCWYVRVAPVLYPLAWCDHLGWNWSSARRTIEPFRNYQSTEYIHIYIYLYYSNYWTVSIYLDTCASGDELQLVLCSSHISPEGMPFCHNWQQWLIWLFLLDPYVNSKKSHDGKVGIHLYPMISTVFHASHFTQSQKKWRIPGILY